jgi:hypothetical protein
MTPSAFLALVAIELRRYFRAPGTMFWTLAFPFMRFGLFMGVFGAAQPMPTVTIAIVDQDKRRAAVRTWISCWRDSART